MSFQKVKEYLLDLEYDIISEDVSEEVFIVSCKEHGISSLIIDCEDFIVILEQLIMIIRPSEQVCMRLLQMNRCLLHGAFVLDESGTKVLFRDTLQLETLDKVELASSIHALELALAEYGDELISLSKYKH